MFTWLITGTSRGLGRAWATEALRRGDRVVATARQPRELAELAEMYPSQCLVQHLDVTRPDTIRAAFKASSEIFGVPDLVLSNAGYALFGPAAEISSSSLNRLFATNVQGSQSVMKEAVESFRSCGRGTFIQVSSFSAHRTLAELGAYAGSKAAIEALVAAARIEEPNPRIRYVIVRPGPHYTNWLGTSAEVAERSPHYKSHLRYVREDWDVPPPRSPRQAASELLTMVHAGELPEMITLGVT